MTLVAALVRAHLSAVSHPGRQVAGRRRDAGTVQCRHVRGEGGNSNSRHAGHAQHAAHGPGRATSTTPPPPRRPPGAPPRLRPCRAGAAPPVDRPPPPRPRPAPPRRPPHSPRPGKPLAGSGPAPTPRPCLKDARIPTPCDARATGARAAAECSGPWAASPWVLAC